ncbi:MAG TPA: hypothetical protein VKP67_13760 [Xanthobacteraceae bacterium]|nr:hypothetical protein [Xanthobacteraceae bacterium]
MTRVSFATGALLFTTVFAAAAVDRGDYAEPQLNWVMAEASGMTVDYPAGIFTVDAGPSDKGPGRTFRSADGTAGFMFYMQANEKLDTPSSFLRSRLSAPHTKIDYRRVTDRFVAVSGVRDGRIYYSRCNFPQGAAGPMHCMEMVYNEREKRFWDPVVTRASLSLR